MKPISRHRVVALVVAAGVLLGAQAFADPPDRVARLNYLKGSVSFRPASLDDWAPATLNYPLTAGDHLWTEESSWAEMHVGSTAIRLAPSTAFAFLNLDDRTTQIRLSEGAADVRVRNLDGSEQFEIDTPSAAIVLTRPGIYRVDVLPDGGGSTRVTVRYGMASVTADGPDFVVRDGETAAIYGTDEVSHEIFRAAAPDNWENWCRARDEREDRSSSVRYVSYEMTGYEDLDDNGTWTNVPEYGWGWQPRVAYGWAPYHYGHWRWVTPWGWTWVDDAAWGFAPFHYGRWACMRGSWYWFPGSYVVRPVYAPALVAFIGGDNWGLSIGFGHSHVGWFPLAPGEMWMPHYHASHSYVHRLNVTNVRAANINVNNYDPSRGTYVNRAIAGAVTAVPRDAFVGGRAVARDALAVDSRAVMRAPVVGGSAAIAPRVESVTGRRAGYVARPPSTALDRTVLARSEPAAAPVPFAAQERAIQANGGRPLDEAAMARLRSESGNRDFATPVRVAGTRAGGFRGQPARADAARGDQPGAAPASPGTVSGSGAAGLGSATRRPGERPVDGGRPGNAQPQGGNARPEASDRPSWARPRAGGDATPANPRYGGEQQAPGVRGRPADTMDRPAAGAAGLPGGGGEARPRWGDQGNRPPESSTPSRSDRPTFGRSGSDATRPPSAEGARPSGDRPTGGDRPAGESARPSGDGSRPAGARPRSGGDAAPAPAAPSSKPAPAATPRSGGRGGETTFFESSTRPEVNAPRAYGYSAERPTPRPMPESRPAPGYQPAVPPPPPSQPPSQPRGEPRPFSGAAERRGGERAPSAAPPPPPPQAPPPQAQPQQAQPQQQQSSGQASPRGGARNHGRGGQ